MLTFYLLRLLVDSSWLMAISVPSYLGNVLSKTVVSLMIADSEY